MDAAAERAPDMIYRLRALNGAETRLGWSVPTSPAPRGGDPSCEARLTDPEVAARHAETRREGDEFRIRDLAVSATVLTESRAEGRP